LELCSSFVFLKITGRKRTKNIFYKLGGRGYNKDTIKKKGVDKMRNYIKVAKEKANEHQDYTKIPDYTLNALQSYVYDKIPTGGFLKSVLKNELSESFAKADSANRKALYEITCFIYNELPATCWGNEEKVKKWLANR